MGLEDIGMETVTGMGREPLLTSTTSTSTTTGGADQGKGQRCQGYVGRRGRRQSGYHQRVAAIGKIFDDREEFLKDQDRLT